MLIARAFLRNPRAAMVWREGFVISTIQPPPAQIFLVNCSICDEDAVAIAKAVAANSKLT